MSVRKKFAVTVSSVALVGGALWAGLPAVAAPTAAAPAKASTATSVTTTSEGLNCEVPYLRNSVNYNGYTSGYSWAWNVEVGINYNNGEYSDRVKELQCLLNNLWGYDAGAEDGFFGPDTEDAVKKFQKDVGLAFDGIVGPNTWRVLRIGYQK